MDILYNKKYAATLTQNKELLDGVLDRSYSVNKVYKVDGTYKMMVFNSVFKILKYKYIKFVSAKDLLSVALEKLSK